MKLVKTRAERWETPDKKYSVTINHGRIKGLYPKYYVSAGIKKTAHVSTLKEAQAVIDKWENE